MNKVIFNKLIVYVAVVISLIFTPFNFDALIIPKVILLFVLALYLLPVIFLNIRFYIKDRQLLFLFIVSVLILIQMLLVMIISKAPFAQEFYGRTGRGLGIATFFSVLVLLLCMATYSQLSDSYFIIKFLVISGLVSSLYALMQRFNLDIFNWSSRTNGIIGTLGNPNFQSSFVAMALIPAVIYSWSNSYKYVLLAFSLLVLISTLYFTQSTQGYVAVAATLLVFLLLQTWYKKRSLFYVLAISGFSFALVALGGMLNKGPLAYYLYKISIQSRGDFWRGAFNAANSNPTFGIGIDSFGDSYLLYRDEIAIKHTFAEMTDNAHNYFLEFAATGGYPLAILYILIVLFTLYSFFSLQKKLQKFDPRLASIFCAWVVFQMQSIISPGTISLIVWNAILSGFLIGANVRFNSAKNNMTANFKQLSFRVKTSSLSLLIIGILVMYPFINSDRILRSGMVSKDGAEVMRALTMYPESSVKYNIFTQELLKSNLPQQALEMGRAAIKFNPNAVSAWALIFVNPQAPISERLKARSEIIRLDPRNTEVYKYKLE
jgi:O-antigen ligase